ncbi:MAG: hypothetical protein M1819_005956 [Sarea resinae]|nr:MAG: hypothetical protein M1819_005956 [Sarea resinae]
MAPSRPLKLPILPLPPATVLLPSATLNIPILNRPDIPAILAQIYSRASTPKPDQDSVLIGCIPLRSPLLSQDGQKLIDQSSAGRSKDAISDVDTGSAKQEDLFSFGTVAKITGVQGRRPGELALSVKGVGRFKLEKVTQQKPYLEGKIIYHDDEEASEMEGVEELFTQLKQLSRELLTVLRVSAMMSRGPGSVSPVIARRLETFIAQRNIDEAGGLADLMTSMVETSYEEKLLVLAAWPIKDRLELAIELLQRQVAGFGKNFQVTTISTTRPSPVQDIQRLPQAQREALAKRQVLRNGLVPPNFMQGKGKDVEDDNEMEELKRKLEEAKLPPEAQKVADREMQRLKKMIPAQAEYQVCRTYLETLSEIPWSKMTDDHLDAATLSMARQQLNDDHYGLEKIKKRLLEYLAVLKLKQSVNEDLERQIMQASEQASGTGGEETVSERPDAEATKVQLLKSKRMVDKSPILLLVGPPGTGKTSLAKSVANALGRKFHRISLGGVRDEAEIRGHRRTYVAAMPGLIVNGLKKVGVNNPVILLDEIDKVSGSSFHGDPSAAMLEVLDPEQNHSFKDHYVNIPIDLSKVLFIATANTLDTIPAPLLDRMEMIGLSGYTTVEKRHIATRHLIPKQITTNGLGDRQVILSDEVVDKIITGYTRESGVRNLEREIGSVCRFKAVEYADAKDASKLDGYNPEVHVDDLEHILGIEKYDEEIAATSSRPGIVTGLVAYSTGGQGSILFIEVADMPGNGRVQLTGKLGDVLKESVEVALTWVKAHAYDLGLTSDPTEDIMKNRSVHVHCPSGAVPKDGPSAGLAHTVALISLFSGKAVPPSLAMTGEVSLRGRVTAVGGIKEKLIGALRAGVKTVLLPASNRKDVKDLPQEVLDGLRIVHVQHIWEALQHVWPDAHWPGQRAHQAGIESRL